MRIRTRLTLWYAIAFFVAGAVLIALMYGYFQFALSHRPIDNARTLFERVVERGGPRLPIMERLVTAVSDQAALERREALRGILVFSLVALGGTGLVAVGIGWLLAGRALAPLHAVTATARRVADTNLNERIAMTGPDDEIKVLADTFDGMLERLDRAFDGQRRFVANASHELRTPLAINRTLIEVALDDPDAPDETRRLGETLLAVNHRQERLIEGLLVLASSERRLETGVGVDLADITERAVRTVRTAQKPEVSIDVQTLPVRTVGDPALLERLAANLIDNAVRYNVAGGWVRVVAAPRGERAVLTVENSGPVIDPGDVEALFEPFRRMESGSSGGSGLGLSIVRSIVTAHGGALRPAALADGGLAIEVDLPGGQ